MNDSELEERRLRGKKKKLVIMQLRVINESERYLKVISYRIGGPLYAGTVKERGQSRKINFFLDLDNCLHNNTITGKKSDHKITSSLWEGR